MEIKSKIELRHECVSLAIRAGYRDREILDTAKHIEAYIIGDAELPETDSTMRNYLDSAIGIMGAIKEQTPPPPPFPDFIVKC